MTPVPLDTLLQFRERWPHLIPFEKCLHNGAVVEVVSFPWPDGNSASVNVRLEPGDPTTMVTVSADETAAARFGDKTLNPDGTVNIDALVEDLLR